MNRKNSDIALERDQKDAAKAALSAYLQENFSVETGNLGAELFLNYITEYIGPLYYNMGVQDALHYMEEKVDDMYFLMRDIRKNP